ncbi:MAG: hypothetical protein AAGJ08_04135 [Cyanobacteria bacterium P01_H01_bin.35]
MEIFSTHHLWQGAARNEFIIALLAIAGKFHYPSPLAGASENELTIALYATVGKFYYRDLNMHRARKKAQIYTGKGSYVKKA